MKQSGIDWIGEIPEDWKIEKAKHVFRQRFDKGNKIKLQLLSPTQKFGVIPQTLYEELTTYSAVKLKEGTDLSTFKTVHKGDFCISLRSFQGGFEYSRYEGVVSPAYQIFYATEEIDDGYYKYLFKDQTFIAKINSYTMSLRDGKNIAFSDFGNTFIPLPPKVIQQRIAEYLDKKVTEIDSIIEESKKSIEEYKAWKQSVIFEAVTGKNLSCKKKDSGIEWIGEIPEAYIKTKIKYLLDIKGRIGFRGYTNADMVSEGEGAITLSPSNLKNLKMDFSKKAFVSWEKYNESPEIQIKIDDILFVKTGSSYGKSSLVDYLPVESTINPQLVVFKNIKCNENFLIYYLQTNIIQNQVENIVIGGTIPTMSQEKMKNMFVFLPPLPEQESIAKMLDSKCAQIDSLIAEKESLIADLTEYKKSLIFEVVTGKRSV